MSSTPLKPTGENVEPWLIAKENFLKGLSREEQRVFRSASPQTVQQDIARWEKDTNSHVRSALLKCDPFFKGVQGLDAVVSPIAGLEPHGIAAIVWGSVKICLNLIQGYTEVFFKVEDFLTKVGDQLGRLGEYKKLYKTTTPTRFTNALVRVFEKYLAFIQHVKEFFEASKFKHIRDAIGFSKQEHNKQALVSLSMDFVRAECDNAVAEAGVAEAQARAHSSQTTDAALNLIDAKLDVVNDAVERVHDDAERWKRKEILESYLKWLKHVDVDSRLKDLLIPKERVETSSGTSTGGWLFADGRFKNWVKPTKNSNHILWLTGDPGYGKSTLAAYVVTEMQKWQPTGVAYFFCTYQNTNTRTVDAILRSWIWQLLTKPRFHNATAGHLALPEDEYEFTQSEEPTCDIMCDVMRQLFQQRRPTTLIVDGLDECQEPLEDTAEDSDWTAFFELLNDAPEEWKVLLISRPRTWFRKKLLKSLDRDGLEREITSKDNNSDISDFVTQKLQSIADKGGWDSEFMRYANTVLYDNADGMFLYVSQFCEDLRYKKMSDARAALDKPPKGLQGLYDRTMQGIDGRPEDLKNELRTALKWIVCTFRALKLEELAAALDFTPEVKDNLSDMLGSFVRIEQTTSEIMLVHASARDYLLSPAAGLVDTASVSDQAKLVPVHEEILARCIQYLTDPNKDFVLVDQDRFASQRRMREALKSDPFLEYAAIHWIQHLAELAKLPERLEGSKKELDKLFLSEISVLKWLQHFHFLFQFNFAGSSSSRNMLGGLVFHPPKENTWQMFIKTHYKPFIDHLGWSDGGRFTRWDRFMHVRHEFNHHDQVGRWYQTPTCFSGPLLAAFFNYTDILEQMVQAGEDKDKKSSLDSTPLVWAATADSCSALQWLIDAGANIEVPYRHTTETPIFRAVRVPHAVRRRPGRYPAALLLHAKGAKLKVFPDDNGYLERTVLITLIEECPDSPGSAELVRAILQDDPARYRDYVRRGSVLQTAAWFARPLVLKALLEDEYIRARIDDQVRATAPIHDACSSNHPMTVKALIDGGANLNLRSELNGLTPLQAAVLSGGATIPTLLNAGADPNLGAFNDNTAVHLAAENNVNIDFKLCFEKGHDIDRVNAHGKTALALALEHSNFAIVSTLLDLGADINKIPIQVLQSHRSQLHDKRLEAIRREAWEPCWSYELAWLLRHAKMKVSLFSECEPAIQDSQRALQTFPILPLPIIARIFERAGLYEMLVSRRDGRVTVNEALTLHGGENQPYIQSQPIFGACSVPIRRLVCRVFGCCQHFGGQRAYSFYEIKTVEGKTKRCIKWQPEVIWGHNGYQLQEKKRELLYGRQGDKKYLERIHVGDRVGVVQRAHYAGWENTTEWASIQLDISVLRDQFTGKEKENIWPHNRNTSGQCLPGRCPRCAIEKNKK